MQRALYPTHQLRLLPVATHPSIQPSKAVRSIVPQSMWAAILEELEELEQHPEALDVGTDSFDDDDDDEF